MPSKKFLLAIVLEDTFEEMMEFESVSERDQFNEGMMYGGSKYGAGQCAGFRWPDDAEQIGDEFPYVYRDIRQQFPL